MFHDEFNRTITGGWGTADTGGSWLTPDLPERMSVANGKGRVRLAPGDGITARLPQVASDQSDMLVSLSVDKRAGKVGHYLSFVTRDVAGVGRYSAKLGMASDGSLTWWLLDSVSGSDTYLNQASVPMTYAAGQKIWVRVQSVGTAPTTLRARVWPDGTAEPRPGQCPLRTGSSGLQRQGSIALSSYSGGAADGTDVTVRYHRVVIVG